MRALKFVLSELHLHMTSSIFLLVLCKCVLHWIKSQKPLSLFVTNRLKEIRSIEGLKFKHLSSEDNPTGLPTRGKCPKDLNHPYGGTRTRRQGCVIDVIYSYYGYKNTLYRKLLYCFVYLYIYHLDTGGHTQKAEPV